MSRKGEIRAQVAVVGGGPVGLLVAADLGARAVDTVVIERAAAVSEQPKANTLHARAVQCLARRGHLPAGSAPYVGGASPFHFGGLPGLVITAPEGEPEPILKCSQADLERLFEERARRAGVRILREHQVTGIVQEPDGVRITAEGPGGTVTCVTGYAVGADGARSTVREQSGIESETYPATVAAMAATVTLPDPAALAPGWHRTPRGWIVAKPDTGGRTHVRTANFLRVHADRHSPLGLEELRREASWIAGREIAMDAPRWLSRFSDFTRLARNFRAGRVFLAGDAAHMHFPIGGQGLSAGVLDALDLSWKLALAVHGTASAGLLDTYDLERRPAARRIVENTRAQLALMREGTEADALRAVFAEILAADPTGGCLGGMISAQDTVLPEPTGWSAPDAGRFLHNVALTTATVKTDVIGLLAEGKPLLLLFGEKGSRYRDAAREWEGTLRVVHAMPTPDVPHEALLVRPDGYIAWAPGRDGLAVALSAYLARGVRVRHPRRSGV
ncbi:FAD-dependent monooxygenase (plasmid) [Streptomyces sp. NBC_01298]|uniref:FAD-dependent monooxygenase n=1 Tax=Streptomyces sp. NBC_01298 TaxID=2903817 RepID=UPI002E117000|nr:FAD-dependent monooxygenase [Streptomyces sp. NBC_01298]